MATIRVCVSAEAPSGKVESREMDLDPTLVGWVVAALVENGFKGIALRRLP